MPFAVLDTLYFNCVSLLCLSFTEEDLLTWLDEQDDPAVDSLNVDAVISVVKTNAFIKIYEPGAKLRIIHLFRYYLMFLSERKMGYLPRRNTELVI